MQRITDKLLLSTRLSAKLAMAGMLGLTAIGLAGAQEVDNQTVIERTVLPAMEVPSGQEDPTQSTITQPEGQLGKF